MDLLVRYWSEDAGKVCTRYMDSRFLKRPNAQNLVDALLNAIKPLTPQRLVQLSMDGPNTNWNVFELLTQNRAENEYPPPLNMGCCGLHVVHGALGTGLEATPWNIGKILKAMWKMFHDSPARRDVYIRVTECDEFPLK